MRQLNLLALFSVVYTDNYPWNQTRFVCLFLNIFGGTMHSPVFGRSQRLAGLGLYEFYTSLQSLLFLNRGKRHGVVVLGNTVVLW